MQHLVIMSVKINNKELQLRKLKKGFKVCIENESIDDVIFMNETNAIENFNKKMEDMNVINNQT